MLKQVLKQNHRANSSLVSSPTAQSQKRHSRCTSPWDTPAIRPSAKVIEKKVLVLDLDETLVYARNEICQKGMIQVFVNASDLLPSYNVSLRPGLKEFLDKMQKLYTLIIFTAGTKHYAEAVISQIGIKHYFKKILHRDHCTPLEEGNFTKEILKLGAPEKDILLLDDLLIHAGPQENNFLHVKPYLGNPDDKELFNLIPFLTKLAREDDVRPVTLKYTRFLEEKERGDSTKRSYTLQKTLTMDSKSSSPKLSMASTRDMEFDEATMLLDEGENCEDEVNENSFVQETSRGKLNSSMFDIMKIDLGFSKTRSTERRVSMGGPQLPKLWEFTRNKSLPVSKTMVQPTTSSKFGGDKSEILRLDLAAE